MNGLTPEDFEQLPANEKINAVLTDGKEILNRIYIYYVIKLYNLNGFFVEIWYQQISNKIDRVHLVELSDVVHLYESQINISDLFK